MAERARLPYGLLEEVIAARYFRRAVAANKANVPGWEHSAMRTLAREIELEIVAEDLAAHA